MGNKTAIEWTDATWNPIRGCSRVSEGCRNCYAEGVARRFSGKGLAYEGLVRIGGDGKPHEWNGAIKFVEDHLLDPIRWKTPRRIFVNSMSDLFHENVTDEMRDKIFAVMALCPQHTFQVLTKRPERMQAYLQTTREGLRSSIVRVNIATAAEKMAMAHSVHAFITPRHPEGWPLPNVWLGISVENQQAADERVPLLLKTPVAVRFLSCEPLLGPLNLHAWLCEYGDISKPSQHWSGAICEPANLIHWVITGGESGPNARPMRPSWALSLRDQCASADVPFFFKQWGEWLGGMQDGNGVLNCTIDYRRVGKKAAGHLLDGVEHHAFPEVR